MLQNVGFCILNRKETYLTSSFLQEPFEIFHASGFWPNLFSTAGKHLQLLVYVALTDLWILLDKVCVAFHLNINKTVCSDRYQFVCLFLLLSDLKLSEDNHSGISLKWENLICTLKIQVMSWNQEFPMSRILYIGSIWA